MDELDEIARELLAERIQSIRKGFAKEQPEDWKDKSKNHMERMDAILQSLPDAEREWLDDHLTDGMMVSEEECTALYLAGMKDSLKLFKRLL